MQTFSSKELYMMNGGNKLYIHKDGFGDIYNSTAAEEQEWAREIVANALAKIDTEANAVVLKFAIESLRFHNYTGLEALLIQKAKEASPVRQVVFATALWNQCKYHDSFEIVYQNLCENRAACLDIVFISLDEFKANDAAKKFLLSCLEGDDDTLFIKAHTTISLWAYTGMPLLRENNLLDLLKIENRNEPGFKSAVENLKQIFWAGIASHIK